MRTLKPKGDILGLGLGVNCGSKAPAEFELIGLRFESDEKSDVEPIKEDAPVTVRVVDPLGKPVEGATVTVDPERVNWTRKPRPISRDRPRSPRLPTRLANIC